MTGPAIIRAGDLRPVPWRNGQGITRDVVTHTGPDGALLWQVSIAELTRDADFSYFPECDRVFTPVSGGPVELSFSGGPFQPCPLLRPVPFAGEWPTRCRVAGQPARAFNVIADRHIYRAACEVMILEGLEPCIGSEAQTVVHCLSGRVQLGGGMVLDAGDSLVLQSGAGVGARGEATLLVAVVTPVSAPENGAPENGAPENG